MSDLIYRKDAIRETWKEPTYSDPLNVLTEMRDRLEALPSAEPESLTDKEQRIFLSAMERERKVCRQVDEEWRNMREPYEDSLVHMCNEIERKVKGALWT